jgi:hypothetical protein
LVFGFYYSPLSVLAFVSSFSSSSSSYSPYSSFFLPLCGVHCYHRLSFDQISIKNSSIAAAVAVSISLLYCPATADVAVA